MTSRQTGKRISTLYNERRSSRGGARSQPKQNEQSGRGRRRLAQLVICGTLFVTLVAVKLLLPAKMNQIRSYLNALMNQNMNVEEVFSAVGRAFSGDESVKNSLDDVYEAVFHPDEGEAVATAASASENLQVPSPLKSMRAFADGSGGSDGWLNPSAGDAGGAEEKQSAAQKAAESAQPSDSKAAASSGEVQTMKLSSVLYSGENIPANVSLQQAVLGFDYCTPVCGTLSSGFGYREHPIQGEEKFHYGVDLAADQGTEIDCFADGTVTAVGESTSYGKYLTVAHKGGYTTLYAHCSSVTVSSGTRVKEGQKIAEVGQTGLATGPHLHFELHEGATYLDPIYYVKTT